MSAGYINAGKVKRPDSDTRDSAALLGHGRVQRHLKPPAPSAGPLVEVQRSWSCRHCDVDLLDPTGHHQDLHPGGQARHLDVAGD